MGYEYIFVLHHVWNQGQIIPYNRLLFKTKIINKQPVLYFDFSLLSEKGIWKVSDYLQLWTKYNRRQKWNTIKTIIWFREIDISGLVGTTNNWLSSRTQSCPILSSRCHKGNCNDRIGYSMDCLTDWNIKNSWFNCQLVHRLIVSDANI